MSDSSNEVALARRIAAQPRPAILWSLGVAVLLLVEFGAVAHAILNFLSATATTLPGEPLATTFANAAATASEIPTVLSRDLVPNQGYWTGRRWVGTFLGLEPAHAWAVRVALVYLYAFAWLAWSVVGYRWFRTHYRHADWTPRDDVIDRFKTHRWGQFGLAVVFLFVVMAVFAPTLGPTTVEKNIEKPFDHEFRYYDEETESVESTFVGTANRQSVSKGTPDQNVGLLSYDDYGRFHPFGTTSRNGKDLFTFVVSGARVSLTIGILSVVLSGTAAVTLGLVSAFYRGWVDLGVVFVTDAIMALPQLLLLVLLAVVLADTWIAGIYDGGMVLVFVFAFTGWPILWRSIRGPALQISERTWVDAARSFGRRPRAIMREHMLPYLVGYILIYGSMTLGGTIIALAGLSFLGLGIDPPTPEWGRAVEMGQDFVTTRSWHVSLVPGLLITLVVTGFNALSDGIRDAIDPQSDAVKPVEQSGA